MLDINLSYLSVSTIEALYQDYAEMHLQESDPQIKDEIFQVCREMKLFYHDLTGESLLAKKPAKEWDASEYFTRA